MKKKVLILSREGCSRCEIVKRLFTENEIVFEEGMIDAIPTLDKVRIMGDAKAKGQSSMPIILIDGEVNTKDLQEVMTLCK